jgi:mRNA interferase HigB
MIFLDYVKVARFMRDHAPSRKPLDGWKRIVENAKWKSFEDVKASINTADRVGDCIVFNIAGKKFRLIASVDYDDQVVQIKQVLTHAEYNRDKWKKDC